MYEPAIREVVRELRRKGYTFREIIEKLPFLSKGTVSYWTRDIILTPEQEKRILQKQLKGRVKLIEYNKNRHREAVKRARKIISEAKRKIGKLSKRDLLVAGTALYWAEGYKRGKGTVDFGNSDPRIIALIMRFFREICRVPEHRFRCAMTIHPGINEKDAIKIWSKVTNIPPAQFTKTYIKPPKTSTGKMHNILYNGSLKVRFSDVKIFHRIQGFIMGLGA